MTEIVWEKVAGSTAEGKISVYEDLYQYDSEVGEALFAIPKSLSTMYQLIRFGVDLIESKNEREALDIFQNAYYSLSSLKCSDERKIDLAYQIRSHFLTLNSSDDEYVWECTGEYIHACEHFIKKLNPEEEI